MEVHFRLNQWDINNFTKYSFIRLPGLLLTIFMPIIFISQTIFLVLLSFGQGTASMSVIFIVSNLSGLLVTGAYLIHELDRPRHRHWHIGENTININSYGLRLQCLEDDRVVAWSNICNVVSTNECIYVFVDWFTALIIPKRAFATSLEAEDFFVAAMGFWRQYKVKLRRMRVRRLSL